MKKPLVSLVIPTMNSAPWIEETLYSLAEQKYTNFEAIIVDGGSTDATVDIARSYEGDGDLRVIELPPKLGISKALNVGLSEAKGRFIARMDADDIAYEWRLHDQVKFLINNPDIDLVGTGADAFGRHEGVFRNPLSHQAIVDEYLINNPFYHPTIMFRRKVYDDGLYHYDEDLVCEEDYELWGRLLPRIKVANMDQSSIRYRVLGGSAQWNPTKYRSKKKGVESFCATFGMNDPEFIMALIEFQNSMFVRPRGYEILREYAQSADKMKLPKLGWIQQNILNQPDYAHFQMWFRKAKGWPL